MTLRPYKHLLPTYRAVMLFFKNYLPMARINLTRVAALLIAEQTAPLNCISKTWQAGSHSLIAEIVEHSCL
ncbi:MAG: hypothetical protein F6K11_16215 [Leptolyngbya sp. SIO3F4]|nr:hypothetical protein [Leptolyngbya sp. SIO3F4]